MENRIIEINKADSDYKCLICCKNNATMKMRINRLVNDDSIINFHVCNGCFGTNAKGN